MMDNIDIKLGAVEFAAKTVATPANAAANVPLYYEHGLATFNYLTSDEVRKSQQDAIKARSTERLNALRMKTLGAQPTE